MNAEAQRPEPVPQPLIGRQRRLIRALWAGVALAGILAAAAVVLPSPTGDAAGRAFLGAVIAVPPLRVVWLTVRWLDRRDRHFALVGMAVLVVAAAAVGSALVA